MAIVTSFLLRPRYGIAIQTVKYHNPAYILNKSENAPLLLLVKMVFQFPICKIKCQTSSYHLRCIGLWVSRKLKKKKKGMKFSCVISFYF